MDVVIGMAKNEWQKNGEDGFGSDYIIFLPLIFLPFMNHCVEVTFDLAFEVNSNLISANT